MSGYRDMFRSTYHEYIGEPAKERDIYVGFGLFFAGVALAILGFCLFLYSNVLESGSPLYWEIREIALVIGFIGLPSVLLSVVVLLPVGFRTRVVSAAGAVFCLAATIILVNIFPYGWTTSEGTNGSVWTISVYATGLVMLVASIGAALVAHYLERATTSTESPEAVESAENKSESVSKSDVDTDIEQALERTDLSWGGVEQQPKTKRLNLDMPDTDSDLDRTAIKNSEATTTRADSNDIDDAVDGLRQLQGGQSKTERSTGTEEQVNALTEFRNEQTENDDVETGVEEEKGIVSRLQSFFK
ncbi:permease [Haloarcula sebkhae]|uniref:Permease n=2 Tax=Haloarcula sebkhae TaxID=932660 RepID=A0ACC6VQV7_9EURY|nr:permease [Haloarcula sebkhae]